MSQKITQVMYIFYSHYINLLKLIYKNLTIVKSPSLQRSYQQSKVIQL